MYWNQRYHFADKGLYSQSYGCSHGHLQIWELYHQEDWALNNWCFWTVVLEKTLESSVDCKEIKPVHPKGNQSWKFIGRTDAEAPILWWPDAKSWLMEKTLMLEKIEGKKSWRRQRMRWLREHHWFRGHEFEQTRGDSEGQGNLAGCSPWHHKESDTT